MSTTTRHPFAATTGSTTSAGQSIAHASTSKQAEGPKTDKAKLTIAHGPPPDVILRDGKDRLTRGQLLGEGGFARVYQATDDSDGSTKAVKVIAKEQLKSAKNKAKLFGEIKIHQAMQHVNIISFEHCFEDEANVYMQLELCANGSMLDIVKKRKRYSEPEARFYLVQLIGACFYMHDNMVIHRDLKLGNLMLDADMNLKVGDFGLAALVKFPGERKKTICGTPNYIAPEILFDTTNGHSFEVDIWSIGVILYTLLIGKPPFQTKDVKNIYRKIRDNAYQFPEDVTITPEATDLISSILTTKPVERPSLSEILAHPWFTTGPFPANITPASLTSAPDYSSMSIRSAHRNFKAVKALSGITDQHAAPSSSSSTAASSDKAKAQQLPVVVEECEKPEEAQQKSKAVEAEVRKVLQPGSPISDLLKSARKPLVRSPRTTTGGNEAERGRAARQPSSLGRNHEDPSSAAATAPKSAPSSRSVSSSSSSTSTTRKSSASSTSASASQTKEMAVAGSMRTRETRYPARELYETTWRNLDAGLSAQSSSQLARLVDVENVSAPKVFISSWVDYTQKYGTAWSLTDGSAGLYFNDSTTMVMSPDKTHCDYIANRSGNVYSRRHYLIKSPPAELNRKAYLVEYFDKYMTKTLTRGDVDWTFVDTDRKKNMDFLVKYYRMVNAIVFKLSNDVLQFNFYDHSKVLLTEQGRVVSFIDEDFRLVTYGLASLVRLARADASSSSSSSAQSADEKERTKAMTVLAKVEYCRDVIRNLANRRLELQQQQPSSKAPAASSTTATTNTTTAKKA